MRSITCVVCLTVLVILAGCSGPAPQTSAPVEPQASASVAVDPDVAEENQAAAEDGQPAKAPVPSNAHRVRARSAVHQRHQHWATSGVRLVCRAVPWQVRRLHRPQAPRSRPTTRVRGLPPHLIETRAHGHPMQIHDRGRTFDPRNASDRPGVCAVATELRLRQPCRPEPHAHAHRATAITRIPLAASVPATHQSQKWYPAPRMIYGNPSQPGAREAAQGMTLERTVARGELGANTEPCSQLRRRLLRRARRAHVCACVVHVEPRR